MAGLFNYFPHMKPVSADNNQNPIDALSAHVKNIITEIPAAMLAGKGAFKRIPKNLKDIAVMPLRDIVPFPGVSMPITVERDFNKALALAAEQSGEPVLLVTQKDGREETPSQDSCYSVGVIARVLKVINLPDGNVSVLLNMQMPATLKKLHQPAPFYRGDAVRLTEEFPADSEHEEMGVIFSTVIDYYKQILAMIPEEDTRNISESLGQLENPMIALHFISVNSPLEVSEKQRLLETMNIKERATLLAHSLYHSLQLMQMRADVARRTQERLSQQQREHYMRQQMAVIEDELGGSIEDEEIGELECKAEKMNWSEKAAEHFAKEMRKLDRFPANSPEYGIQYTYLENMLSLPWNNYSQDNFDLKKVRHTLDADHFGLEKVKERIVEQMAVLKLRGDMKAPILCLYGPPGVGKTSLGRSIASAIGREYARVALGGVHDEAEIRGHRRTYVGAMPGRIIAALEKVGTGNPVFVLDEIDKISRDAKGDPSTALLEVLDPEQNNKFHDNYLNFDYDLSRVMFIATANDLSTISHPLLDRMELIEIPGYVTDEKVSIATKHLLPKTLEEHGLKKNALRIPKDAMEYIIDRYTHESGVRKLEKQLARLVRRLAVKEVEGEKMPEKITVETVRDLLGPELVDPDKYEGNSQAGVVTGLAWTAAGGEILFIEVSLSRGKGKLSLTGQLGDVMKESATIALEYIKAHAPMLDIPAEVFNNYDIHLHVPEGAIPKDGPSAGVTMATALASAFTRRLVAPSLAMSGEITLRGKVLPVGGIKEKILAAKRAGISNIILSEQNRKDIEQINERYLKGLKFNYVKTISEVLTHALTNEVDTTLPPRVSKEEAAENVK